MGWPWPIAPRYYNVLRNEDYTAGKPIPHPIETDTTGARERDAVVDSKCYTESPCAESCLLEWCAAE